MHQPFQLQTRQLVQQVRLLSWSEDTYLDDQLALEDEIDRPDLGVPCGAIRSLEGQHLSHDVAVITEMGARIDADQVRCSGQVVAVARASNPRAQGLELAAGISWSRKTTESGPDPDGAVPARTGEE